MRPEKCPDEACGLGMVPNVALTWLQMWPPYDASCSLKTTSHVAQSQWMMGKSRTAVFYMFLYDFVWLFYDFICFSMILYDFYSILYRFYMIFGGVAEFSGCPVFFNFNVFPEFERSTGNSDYHRIFGCPVLLNINVFPDFERSTGNSDYHRNFRMTRFFEF